MWLKNCQILVKNNQKVYVRAIITTPNKSTLLEFLLKKHKEIYKSNRKALHLKQKLHKSKKQKIQAQSINNKKS
jgi:hypothetical protein